MDSKVSFSDSNIMITFFLFKKEKRRCWNGKHHRGKEGGIIETGKPGERASEIWLEGKRKAASGFLGVGACRRGRAVATVKLPGKLINNESPARRFGTEQKFLKKVLTN